MSRGDGKGLSGGCQFGAAKFCPVMPGLNEIGEHDVRCDLTHVAGDWRYGLAIVSVGSVRRVRSAADGG